ncbi:hypothetical protein GGF37_006937, partial [Kickxella alabastrina]
SWDWTQVAPIGSADEVFQPLCKYTKPFKTPSARWEAGETVTVGFQGTAAHSGGHGEFSISYDNGKTFMVLQQELRYMFFGTPTKLTNTPRKLKYSIKLPKNLPGSDNAVFAWTWVNASGNRELYMNCVDVQIIGKAGKITGKEMTVINYGPYTQMLPEFYGDYDTGIDIYSNARNITVTGPGNESAFVIMLNPDGAQSEDGKADEQGNRDSDNDDTDDE